MSGLVLAVLLWLRRLEEAAKRCVCEGEGLSLRPLRPYATSFVCVCSFCCDLCVYRMPCDHIAPVARAGAVLPGPRYLLASVASLCVIREDLRRLLPTSNYLIYCVGLCTPPKNMRVFGDMARCVSSSLVNVE